MNSTNIHVRSDSKLKQDSQKVLKDLGLDMSTFINMALKQLTYKKEIPFEISLPKEKTKTITRAEMCGMLKGKVWMSEDFDAPLEEMEEYM